MSPMEIWLRLMAVQSLSGDKLLKIAHFLLKEPECSVVSLTSAGLSTQQVSHFLEFSGKELEESLDWLEVPDHHLLTADCEHYPAQLRAIDCYPAALFVRGIFGFFPVTNSPWSVIAIFPNMVSVGAGCFANH